jgi:hypothetical protein
MLLNLALSFLSVSTEKFESTLPLHFMRFERWIIWKGTFSFDFFQARVVIRGTGLAVNKTVTVAEIVKRRIGSPVFQVIFNDASHAVTTSSQLNSSNFVSDDSVEDVICLQITLSLTPFHGGAAPTEA